MAKKLNLDNVSTEKADAGKNSIRDGEVYSAAENSGKSKSNQQPEASKEEATERIAARKTQGRKGCRSPRINLAFTPQNHRFIKVMARMTGRSMTDLINDAVDSYRELHNDTYEKALQMMKEMGLDDADDE